MSANFKKFFDPATINENEKKILAADYFEKLRVKLKIAFAFPENPQREYKWNDPHASELMLEYIVHGGKEVLVNTQDYQKRIKELADSKS